MQPVSGKHDGVLFRGPTGDLWFLRYEDDQPRKIDNPDLKSKVEAYMQQTNQEVASELPADIIADLEELLKAFFGPLIGAWCVWGPRTPT